MLSNEDHKGVKNNVFPISLRKLQHLSVMDNKLEEVPAELGHLTRLTEINFTSNYLSWLPHQLYHCKELTKLYVARNKLISLPEVSVHFSFSLKFVMFSSFIQMKIISLNLRKTKNSSSFLNEVAFQNIR